jgi:hypothetical protein
VLPRELQNYGLQIANYQLQITNFPMKFNINLATQPYESARRFYLLWGLALVAIALFTAALIYGAVSGWRNAHAISRHIAAERQHLKDLQARENADLAILNKPDNRQVRDKAQVLNALIRQKEFSWTLIFSDLEHLMPARLHVLSITPKLNKDNEIEVRMQVAGASRDKAIELVQRMEGSREFRHAQVLAENNNSPRFGQSGDLVQFDITALYVPAALRPAEGSGQ